MVPLSMKLIPDLVDEICFIFNDHLEISRSAGFGRAEHAVALKHGLYARIFVQQLHIRRKRLMC